jgi:hypothetical protein
MPLVKEAFYFRYPSVTIFMHPYNSPPKGGDGAINYENTFLEHRKK